MRFQPSPFDIWIFSSQTIKTSSNVVCYQYFDWWRNVDIVYICISFKKLTYVNLYLLTDTLRALYMGDNDFEVLPDEIGKLKNLQIVSLYYISVEFQCNFPLQVYTEDVVKFIYYILSKISICFVLEDLFYHS